MRVPAFLSALLLLFALASAQEVSESPLAEQERAYASQLGLSLGGDERARGATLTEDGGTLAKGIQVRFPKFQVDRFRFRSPAAAAHYAKNLPKTNFVRIRGSQVLHAFGPELPDAALLSKAGWSVLPSHTGTEAPSSKEQSPPAQPEAADSPQEKAPKRATPQRNGARGILGHHLLGEELIPETEPPPTFEQILEGSAAGDDLGSFQGDQAKSNFDAMTPAEQDRFLDLLNRHEGTPAAQAYLLKGLASANTSEDLEWFSNQIEGKDAAWLANNARLTGDEPLTQQFSTSCAPTVAQALRGELDPVYALRLRQTGDVHEVDPANPYANNRQSALEQEALLDLATGRSVARDEQGGRGLAKSNWENVVDHMTNETGLDLALVELSGDAAADVIEENLKRGIPTPFGIYENSGHAVLAVDLREGPQGPEFQVYDPWFGTLTWVPKSDVATDQVDVGTGQPKVSKVGMLQADYDKLMTFDLRETGVGPNSSSLRGNQVGVFQSPSGFHEPVFQNAEGELVFQNGTALAPHELARVR